MEKLALMTKTGEFYQPMRVYYQVLDGMKLAQALDRIECVQPDPENGRLVWLFEDEVRDLPFHTGYDEIDPKDHPIVLGSIRPGPNDQMLIDVRSFERGLEAIQFFANRIKKSVAKVTDVAVCNRLTPAVEHEQPAATDPTLLFERAEIQGRDPEEFEAKTKDLKKRYSDRERRMLAIQDWLAERNKIPHPEFERFPTHFHTDGIHGLKLALTLRARIALEHWKGNTEFTTLDAIQNAIPRPE